MLNKMVTVLLLFSYCQTSLGQNCHVAQSPAIDGKLKYCIQAVDEGYKITVTFYRETKDTFIVFESGIHASIADSVSSNYFYHFDYLHEKAPLKFLTNNWERTYTIGKNIQLDKVSFWVFIDKPTISGLLNTGKRHFREEELKGLSIVYFELRYNLITGAFDFDISEGEL